MLTTCRLVRTYCNSTSLENTLAHEVVMHFDVLRLSMEDRVLCQLDIVKFLTTYHRRIDNLHRSISSVLS